MNRAKCSIADSRLGTSIASMCSLIAIFSSGEDHFGIRRIDLVFQMSLQKKVPRIEVWRSRRAVNAHSGVIPISQNNHTMLKVLCKQSKRVGDAIWMSAILHNPHAIESGSALNDHDGIIGQYITLVTVPSIKMAQTIPRMDIAQQTVTRSGCSDLLISK